MAFLSAYFGGQAAINPDIGALIYIWFCLGGALFTTLSWIFVVESKSSIHQRHHHKYNANDSFSDSQGSYT
jgi:hypothetical protein